MGLSAQISASMPSIDELTRCFPLSALYATVSVRGVMFFTLVANNHIVIKLSVCLLVVKYGGKIWGERVGHKI